MLENISEYFNVSLTSAALRYAEIGEIPCAVIMSKNGSVAWSKINDSFPFKDCTRGVIVASESKAYDIHECFKRKIGKREIRGTDEARQRFRYGYELVLPAEYKREGAFNWINPVEYRKAKAFNGSGIVPAYAWFNDTLNYGMVFLNEINIPMPNYNSVLTVLYQ